MVVLVTDGIVRAELNEVVGFEGYYIGEEIATGKSEILDYEIKVLVRVLDARNRDVADLVYESLRLNPGCIEKERGLTLSTRVGTITFRISFQSWGLNLRLPSASNSRSFVKRAQSSPNLD